MFKSGVGVQAVIFVANLDKVLLIKRSDFPVWTLPGGHMKKGETYEKAIIREVKEETGLSVKIIDYISTYVVNFFPLAGTTRVFLCKATSKDLLRSSKEAVEVKFFSVTHLPLFLLPYLYKRIQDGLIVYGTRKSQKVRR